MLDAKAARGAAFFWLAAIAIALIAYIAWNDPLRYAVSRLQPLALALVFIAACTGLGWLVRAPDLLASAAIGIGVAGGAIFFAGVAHALRPWFFIALIGTGIVAFAVSVARGPRPAVRVSHSGAWVILAVIFALILPFVLAPDVSTDALEYHLLIPKLYLQHNAIDYLPLLVESNYPSLGEYVFAALLAIGDDIAAKSFHFLCAILLLFAIARLARALNIASDGVLAAALFFSMPVAALTSGWAWNDMLFTLFVILTIVHLIEGRFVTAGVLFGFATWTKYTFVLVGVALAAILIRGLIQKWWSVRDVARFAVPVVVIAAIWMTKNAVMTGNPVYPFLNGIFHSPFWTAADDEYFRATLTRYEIPEWHWWTYVAFPFLLTLKPRVIDVQTGVLPLVLLPLLFVRAKDKVTSILRTYLITIVIAWLVIRTETRSLLSLFAILSAIYAARIEVFRGWRVVVGTAVALNAIIILVTTTIVTNPVRYFLGRESRQEYIVREDPKQDAYRWLDNEPSVQGVLLVGLHDPYFLRKPALFSSCCDTPIAQVVDTNALKQRGITHVAFRGGEFTRENSERLYSWTPQQRDAFLGFLRQRCRSIVSVNDVLILRIL